MASILAYDRSMGSRAVQLVLIMALGAAVALLMMHRWRSGEAASTAAASAVEAPRSSGTEKAPSSAAGQSGAVTPARAFNLPPVAPAASAVSATASRSRPDVLKRPVPTLLVPAGWLLRGSAPQDYDLVSDRDLVYRGNASALLKSHDKDISPYLFGSALQVAAAEPFIGKRVHLSAYMRILDDDRERSAVLWLRATDLNSALLISETTSARAPKLTEDWTRYDIVADMPWEATEIIYGVSLRGKGAVWIDDVRIEAIDRAALELTRGGPRLPVGVVVPAVRQGEPLANPTNLGFEEVIPADAHWRDAPRESVMGLLY